VNWKLWLKGLGAAAIGGGATTGGLIVLIPQKFAMADAETLAKVFFVGALIGVLSYLKQSPLPKADG